MGKADEDMLDSALDRAEASLSSRETEVEAPEPEESRESVVEEQQEDIIAAKTLEKERDERGKYTKKAAKKGKVDETPEAEEISDHIADQDVNEAPEQGETPQVEALIDAPRFWSAEKKALFAKVPRDLQQVIAEETQRVYEWGNRVARESESGKATEKWAEEAFKPYETKLRMQGVDWKGAATRLLAWNDIFEQDPKMGIVDLMRKNGLTPHDLLEEDAESAQYQEYQDPRVDDLARQNDELRQQFQSWQENLETQRLSQEVEAFKDGKDSTGQVRRPFATMYAGQISNAAREIQNQRPGMPLSEALTHAYEYVVGEARKMFGVSASVSPTPKPANREQIIANAKKAQAAASSVTGAPTTELANKRSRLKGKNFNEKLESALDIAEGIQNGAR